MNMDATLSAMEERIVMPKNAIAVIVVYFLIVSTFVFSHCKDRPYSLTLQVFSPLFASDIATTPAYCDKYREPPLLLSRRTTFCSFFCKASCLKTKWSVYEHRRSIYLRMLCVCERRCSIF